MSIVAVIGAGSIGSAAAYKLAEGNRFREVRLIDTSSGAAAGQALDIQQAGAIARFETRLTCGTTAASALGAQVVVLADAFGAESDHRVEQGLATLQRLAELDPTLGFVCAHPADTPVIERAVRESTVPWTQVVGSAPVALASATRTLVALELDASPTDIALTLLGVPPEHVILPWSQVTLAGDDVDGRLDPTALRRLERRLGRLWPPGPLALASAAARVSEALAFGSRRLYCCSATLSGEFGARERALIAPLRLGPAGFVRPVVPNLLAHERVRVENALERTASRRA